MMYSHHSSMQGVRQMSKDTGGPIGLVACEVQAHKWHSHK